jgi:RHS repeat-associated protein
MHELSDHLGNVHATVSDRKSAALVDAIRVVLSASVLSFSDYYPFGMQMVGRNSSTGDYRYGFQGQETDDEITNSESHVSYKYRCHDARLGRFLSIDPLAPKYPQWSPYSFSGNQVIASRELEGLEPEFDLNATVGMTLGSDNKRVTGTVSGSMTGNTGSVSANFSVSKDFKLFNQTNGVGMTYSGGFSGSLNLGTDFSLDYTHNTTRYTGHFSSLSNSVSRVGFKAGNDNVFAVSGGWLNDNDLLKAGALLNKEKNMNWVGTDGGRITQGFDYGIRSGGLSLQYSGLMNTDRKISTGKKDEKGYLIWETMPSDPEGGENGTYKTNNLENSFHHYQMLKFSYSGNGAQMSLAAGRDNMMGGKRTQDWAHQGSTNQPGDRILFNLVPFYGVGVPIFNWTAQPGYNVKRRVLESSFSYSPF